jgi:hypothetical protein
LVGCACVGMGWWERDETRRGGGKGWEGMGMRWAVRGVCHGALILTSRCLLMRVQDVFMTRWMRHNGLPRLIELLCRLHAGGIEGLLICSSWSRFEMTGAVVMYRPMLSVLETRSRPSDVYQLLLSLIILDLSSI